MVNAMLEVNVVLFLILLLSYSIQALSGFGSIIIAVTLGTHFFPLSFLLPVIVPLDVLLNSYLVLRYRKRIDYSTMLKSVFPVMGFGLMIGIFLFSSFAENKYIEKLFGLFVVLISARELWIQWRNKISNKNISRNKTTLFLFSGGIIHGMFASGGPMVVYPISRRIKNKITFRSSLALLWLTFNITLTVSYIISAKINITTIKWSAGLIVIIPISIFLGEKLHSRINEQKFRTIIFALLVFSGLAILLK